MASHDTLRDEMYQNDVAGADFGQEGGSCRDAAPGSGRTPSARPQGHPSSTSGWRTGVPGRARRPLVSKNGQSGPFTGDSH